MKKVELNPFILNDIHTMEAIALAHKVYYEVSIIIILYEKEPYFISII